MTYAGRRKLTSCIASPFRTIRVNSTVGFFFVDTRRAGGPRSIWVHPLDDPEWLSTVPRGVDPLQHVENLWQDEPEPTPEPQQAGLPGQPKHGGIAQQLSEQATAQGYQSGPSYQEEAFGIHGPGVRQGNAQTMQQNFPGTTFMHNGQQVQRVTMDDLINYELAKMGSPEEYERNNPPGKVSSKMFHRKETPVRGSSTHLLHKLTVCFSDNDSGDTQKREQEILPTDMHIVRLSMTQ